MLSYDRARAVVVTFRENSQKSINCKIIFPIIRTSFIFCVVAIANYTHIMRCDTCAAEVATTLRADQICCVQCSSVLRAPRGAGALVVATCSRDRPGRPPRGAVRRALQREASGATDGQRAAAARVAQSAVDAVCGVGRGSQGAARAVAGRAMRDALAAHVEEELPEGEAATAECLRRAEAYIVQGGLRGAGCAARGGELLRRARELHGACAESADTPEDAWCLAAVAVATAGEVAPQDRGYRAAALALVARYHLMPKHVCAHAVENIMQYAL